MYHRLDNTQIPAKVRKLIRAEEARGLNELTSQLSQEGIRLRALYTEMLERQLDDMGHREHWGKTLEWKMHFFKDEAREILLHWAKMNQIPKNVLKENGFFDKYANLYNAFEGILASI